MNLCLGMREQLIEPLQVFLRGDSDGRSNKEKLWENVNTGDF